MYFAKFPLIAYTFDSRTSFKLATDILRRISVNPETKGNYALFEKYVIKDGETPETVSFKFYNDTQYHWVIMLLNDIIDPRFDWPLTEAQLFDYVNTKYSGNITGVQYYTISSDNKTVVDPTQQIQKKAVDEFGVTYLDGYEISFPDPFPITNMAHETNLNEEKRTINVLRPKYLTAFVSEFEALLNG